MFLYKDIEEFMLPIRTIQFIVISFVFLTSSVAMAQQFGGNPPSLKWDQINTDTARIIFPRGLEQQASDVAGIVHRLAGISGYTIGNNLRKINIVLQNQTTASNGYVGLGPYRSEFFLTPSQNSFELGSLPWHKMLALHEYRHVQQNNNFRKGLTKAFYYLFGQEGQALASNLAIPDWFWEGDAVFQETLLSRQGRGRVPFFFNDYRSLWASGKNYSWMKLRNGSYRDLTPDHYRLGYLLVAYGREHFGDTLWMKVADDASRFRGLFYPFQKAVKKNTGEDFITFRNKALAFFKDNDAVYKSDSAAAYARVREHFSRDEEYPQWVAADSVIFVRSSYRSIPAFVVKSTATGRERKIRLKNISNDNYFSYRNGKIVYASYKTDPRWRWQNFSVITIADARTGKQRTITKRSKYFSPDISADGSRIAAVLMDPSGANAVQVLDAVNGHVLARMPNDRHLVFTFPKFFSQDKIVSAVRNRVGEMALGIFDVQTGEPQWITRFSMNTIGFPTVNKDTIGFTMSEGSQEKLFAWADGKLLRFLPSENNLSTGSYHLSMLDGNAAYTVYTAVGYHLCTEKSSFERWKPADEHSLDTVYSLQGLSKATNLITDTSSRQYAISRYPAFVGPFSFHSWRPYISDPEYSYSLIGENILNTLQSEAYITYNRNEKYKETGASLAYGRWYPVINAGASYTFDRAALNNSGQRVDWNELNGEIGVSVPLSFVSGTFNQSINASTTLNTQQVYYTGAWKNLYADKKFNFADLSLSAVNQQTTARQQIYPRFAQTLSARYRSILNRYSANQLLLTGAVYLPGIAVTHSLVIQAAYQRRDTLQEYSFTNSFPVSRGYPDINFPRMWKVGVNYHFPLVYPDWGFGNVAYLLRIRANIYYDLTRTRSIRTNATYSFRSIGTELYFDSKWWNQLPVSFGIRYSHLLDASAAGVSPGQWQLVLPLNLLSR